MYHYFGCCDKCYYHVACLFISIIWKCEINTMKMYPSSPEPYNKKEQKSKRIKIKRAKN